MVLKIVLNIFRVSVSSLDPTFVTTLEQTEEQCFTVSYKNVLHKEFISDTEKEIWKKGQHQYSRPICRSVELVSSSASSASGSGGGQRTRERAAEAWPGTLSPSCHLAQAEGSGPHHADLAQKTRTGEGFIHPPTSFIQQTNLRPVGDAALCPS